VSQLDDDRIQQVADSFLKTTQTPDIMSSQCRGGGGSTQGQAPGCSDMAEADMIATE
jgi:hypothetical protein